jgi:hypothetical protein
LDFHYNVVLKKYGTNARLLFTDTDSLTYHIHTEDVYRDLEGMKEYFDTSDYPRDHFLYSRDNCKVLGKFKDECSGQSPLSFVGLRSKMYSLLVDDDHAKMTAKGVKRRYVEKHVKFEMYLDALRNKTTTYAEFLNFKSTAHNIETVHFYKKCLSAYDDKRYVLDDGESTLAFGHKLIT